MVKDFYDEMNPEHNGYVYDPESGRLFRVTEIRVTEECYDEKIRPIKKKITIN